MTAMTALSDDLSCQRHAMTTKTCAVSFCEVCGRCGALSSQPVAVLLWGGHNFPTSFSRTAAWSKLLKKSGTKGKTLPEQGSGNAGRLSPAGTDPSWRCHRVMTRGVAPYRKAYGKAQAHMPSAPIPPPLNSNLLSRPRREQRLDRPLDFRTLP